MGAGVWWRTDTHDKCSESLLMPDLLTALSGFANCPGNKVEEGESLMPGNGTPHRLRCTATLAEGSQRETPPTRLSDSAWMIETCMTVVTTKRRGVVGAPGTMGPCGQQSQQKQMSISGGPDRISQGAKDSPEMGHILRLHQIQSRHCVKGHALRRRCHVHLPMFSLFILPGYSGESHSNLGDSCFLAEIML